MTVPDIVAIGAVNLDYIIDSKHIGAEKADGRKTSSDWHERAVIPGFEYGGERPATAAEIEEALQRLAPLNPVPSPGGSALNTLATIAAAGIPVSVGYVGVRGTSHTDQFAFPAWFSSLGIDDRFVAAADESVGVCISYTDDGQRSLLTTDGANRSIMDHLAENEDALVEHLEEATVILVTSFANLADVTPLVRLLQRVKDRRPEVIISCDPGALWVSEPAPIGVDLLLRTVDWLLVNQQEFDAVTGRSPDEQPADAADRVLRATAMDATNESTPPLSRSGSKPRSGQESGPGPTAILLKQPGSVQIFSRRMLVSEAAVESGIAPETAKTRPSPEAVVVDRYQNQTILTADEIVDDTGTGDAFAAGFLASLVLEELPIGDGVELGQRLARAKLAWPGLSGNGTYSEVYQRFQNR